MPSPFLYVIKSLAMALMLCVTSGLLFLHDENAMGFLLSIAALCEALMASAVLSELEARLKHAKPTSGKEA